MAYQGLIKKFPVDRPLTERDRKYHLKQDERLDLTPYADLSVIKLNSTYLEVVDKFFPMKGGATGFVGLILLGLLAFVLFLWFLVVTGEDPDSFFAATTTIMFSPIFAFGLWGILKESFAYTHYPVRLNRKTRTAYVFRTDGTVLMAPWDDLFFTLDYDQQVSGRLWEIRAHVLDQGDKTVRETFALGINSSGDAEGRRILRMQWEFYRRYMDEGPQAVTQYVKFCMPVDSKREPFRAGYENIFSQFENLKSNAFLALLWLMMWPINWLSVLGRWVAMQTSKIPKWPVDVEAANVIDPGDPYIKDARINPPDLR